MIHNNVHSLLVYNPMLLLLTSIPFFLTSLQLTRMGPLFGKYQLT